MRTLKTLAAIILLSTFTSVIGCDTSVNDRVEKGGNALADMLEAGKYDWVNEYITQKNFPVDPARFTTVGCKVFHFNKVMATAEVEAALRKEGYEPATLEQLLAYGAENAEEQRKYPIAALSSSWVRPGGDRYVPCLYGDGRGRDVPLAWGGPGYQWSASYRFLASRK